MRVPNPFDLSLRPVVVALGVDAFRMNRDGAENQMQPDEKAEGRFALDDDETMNRLKEIKVKLPVSQHIKLHSLKITQNQPISEVVRKALEEYFSRNDFSGE